jgi:hypothetical protein
MKLDERFGPGARPGVEDDLGIVAGLSCRDLLPIQVGAMLGGPKAYLLPSNLE